MPGHLPVYLIFLFAEKVLVKVIKLDPFLRSLWTVEVKHFKILS